MIVEAITEGEGIHAINRATHTVLRGTDALLAGDATITVDFDDLGTEGQSGASAKLTLSVNGAPVAEATMQSTVPARFGTDTFGIGEDSGQPMTAGYQPPFRFTGIIDKVVVEIR